MDPEPAPALTRPRGDVMALFAAMWAAASLFHVLGPSGRAFDLRHDVTAAGVVHALIGLVALVVLLAPRRHAPLAVLALLGIVSAWQEAPVLGNHWYVAAFVDLALLGSLAASRDGRRIDDERLGAIFPPLARWTLVTFYAFAAFAKLNSAFFDTTVSCSTHFLDETARSLGLSTPITVGRGGLASVVPVVVVAVELSVPILLSIRATRNGGVVLGLVFHGAIALDQLHLFSDFSSMLSALFVLFLPAAFAPAALRFVRERLRPVAVAWVALALAVLVASWGAATGWTDSVHVDGLTWLWFSYDAVVVFGVIAWLLRHHLEVQPRPLALDPRARVLVVFPVVVALTGLLPYLELRNAYAYTMYSNLLVVDGESNHLLVRAGLPVGDRQADPVRILQTDDGGLEYYVALGYDLPWDAFRAYLSEHPQASVQYERAGVVHTLAHAADDPSLVTAPPSLVRKLLPLRAIDQQDPPRCQDTFLPAS